jgi:hypothetical protein
MGTHTVSVIIPVKPGGYVRALEQLQQVKTPDDDLEVIVAEGCWPSRQRNLAAQRAGGEILYFLDDDTRVTPSHFIRAAGWFDDPTIAAAGGPSLTPDDDNPWQRAFGAALASPFGGGGVRNRYRRWGAPRATGDHELILCNLGFRRDVFLAAGGLDERLYPNEENELMDRLRSEGYRLLYDPELAVQRSQRPDMKAFIRQLFGYGRGRAEQTLIARSAGLVSLAPALFLLYLLSVPVVGNPVYSLPLLCYVLLMSAGAVFGWACNGSLSHALRLLAVFPALHLSYGAGLLAGFIRPRFKMSRVVSPEVTVRVVKEMGKAWI